MKGINEISAEQLKDWDCSVETKDGWKLARPEGYYGNLIWRFKKAWKVFTGKADILVWHEQ